MKASKDVVDKIIKIVAAVFEVEVSAVTLESKIRKLPNWDSLRHLKLIMAVESEFNVQMSPEDIEELKQIADIQKALDAHTP